jgi:ABC-type glycerol-3-phosphate transport system substrate-binding protein
MVVAEGGEILSEDNTQVAFNSEAGYRAWDILFTGLKNGWFCPPNVQATMGGDFVPFGTGKAAMTYFIRGGCPSFREQLTDDWDVQLPPRGSVDRKTGMGTMGYAMSAQTKDPAATWEVLHYLFTEGMKTFMESYMVVPPITSFYDDPAWRDLPGPPYSNDVFVKAFDIAMLPPKLDFYSTGPFQKAMDDGIDAVLLGNMTTKDAVDRMAAEATKALTG